jgi:hypothetical protein
LAAWASGGTYWLLPYGVAVVIGFLLWRRRRNTSASILASVAVALGLATASVHSLPAILALPRSVALASTLDPLPSAVRRGVNLVHANVPSEARILCVTPLPRGLHAEPASPEGSRARKVPPGLAPYPIDVLNDHLYPRRLYFDPARSIVVGRTIDEAEIRRAGFEWILFLDAEPSIRRLATGTTSTSP